MSDFFYGEQANLFSFYRLPKALFTSKRFEDVSVEAKVLYGFLLDRMGLSVKNGWKDEEGRVYIIFTVEAIMEHLGCSNKKAVGLCGSWTRRPTSSNAGGRARADPV